MAIPLTVPDVPPLSSSRWNLVYESARYHDRQVHVASGLGLSTRIYRYMRADHALSYLDSGHFWFSSVTEWTDPYERWWHEQLFAKGSALGDARALATCWTRRYADEPFWRLYEHRCTHVDDQGQPLPHGAPTVRLGTTVGRMLKALVSAVNLAPAKVFMSPVTYTSEAALARYSRGLRACPVDVARAAAHALSYKRRSFIFERELRVLWLDRLSSSSHRLVSLPPAGLIDDIMVAPVVDADVLRAENLKHEIRRRFSGSVRRSLLYQQPATTSARIP